MLRQLKQKLYNPVCLCCGSFFVQDHLFCDVCYQQKMENKIKLEKTTTNKSIETFNLIRWVPYESDIVSEMVYRLKSDKCLAAWKHYGDEAISQLAEHIVTENIDLIIPVPGSKNNSVHAKIFAETISRKINKPVLNCLLKTNTSEHSPEQKRRNRRQRQASAIGLHEQFTKNSISGIFKEKHALVVDDICTTGSTLRQSINALGPIKKITLLTMFFRMAKSPLVS